MIKKLLLASAILPLLVSTAYAGVTCSKDMRPVDGIYSHIELTDAYSYPGSYNVIYTTSYVNRNDGKIYTNKRTLLTNLRCNTIGLLAYCTNSGYKSISIATTKKKALGYNHGEVIETKTVDIETDYDGGLLNLSYSMKDCESTF